MKLKARRPGGKPDPRWMGKAFQKGGRTWLEREGTGGSLEKTQIFGGAWLLERPQTGNVQAGR